MPISIGGGGGGSVYDVAAAERDLAQLNLQNAWRASEANRQTTQHTGDVVNRAIESYGQRRDKQQAAEADRVYKTQERIAGDQADLYKQQVSYQEQALLNYQAQVEKQHGELLKENDYDPGTQAKVKEINERRRQRALDPAVRPHQRIAADMLDLKELQTLQPTVRRKSVQQEYRESIAGEDSDGNPIVKKPNGEFQVLVGEKTKQADRAREDRKLAHQVWKDVFESTGDEAKADARARQFDPTWGGGGVGLQPGWSVRIPQESGPPPMSKHQREVVKSQQAELNKEMSALQQSSKATGKPIDREELLKQAVDNINQRNEMLGLPLIPEPAPAPEKPPNPAKLKVAEEDVAIYEKEFGGPQPLYDEAGYVIPIWKTPSRWFAGKPKEPTAEQKKAYQEAKALLMKASPREAIQPPRGLPPQMMPGGSLSEAMQIGDQQPAMPDMQQQPVMESVMPTPTGGPVMATPGGMPQVGGLQQMAPSSATPEMMRQFADANVIPQQAPAPPQKVMLPRDLKERASVVRQSAQSLDKSQIVAAALKANPEQASKLLQSLKDAVQERAKSLERGADADPMLLKRITTLGRMLNALTAVPSR